jgi:hypothetical protein
MYHPIPYFARKAVINVKESVNIITPTSIRKRPLANETNRIYLFIFLKYVIKVFTPREVIKSGNPSPIEYADRRLIPLITDPDVLAYNNIPPNMGPTHGVHPAAKVIPTRNEPRYPAGLPSRWIFFSEESRSILRSPII